MAKRSIQELRPLRVPRVAGFGRSARQVVRAAASAALAGKA